MLWAVDDGQYPEVVLIAMLDLNRMTVNRRLRESGFSPLQHIRRAVKVVGAAGSWYREG